MTNRQEMSNGKLTIYLDETNLEKHVKNAKQIAKEYGDNKIGTTNITGNQYLVKIQETCDIAHQIITGSIVPDLFDRLPLRKDGTFPKNRRIPIFKNNLLSVEKYDTHISKIEDMLCIITYDTWEQKHIGIRSDLNEHTAVLAIDTITGTNKIYPLLNQDLSVNDIKSKTAYLKDINIHPGCIYAEKSGTQYLYVGNISYITLENLPYNKSIKISTGNHTYVKITKAITEMINQSANLGEFLEKFILKNQQDYQPFSRRTEGSKRKFVQETGTPFLDRPIPITNPLNTEIKISDIKPMFTITKHSPIDGEPTTLTYAFFL